MSRLIAYGAIIWDREFEEPLLKCGICFELWPIDPEFWHIPSGFQRCQVCRKETNVASTSRWRNRQGVIDTPQAAGRRAANRRYYAENRERLREESLARFHARVQARNMEPLRA